MMLQDFVMMMMINDGICFLWYEIKSIRIYVVYIAFSNACRITDVYKYSSGYRTGHGC